MTDPLFVADGEQFTPTESARGPWDPGALHGGPVAALVARAVERCEPTAGWIVPRLTIELVRPVPLAPLRVSAEAVRPGRNVQVVDVRVRDERHDVAWGRAVRIRQLVDPDERLASGTPPREERLAPPEDAVVSPPAMGDRPAFHNQGVELRFIGGRFDVVGPARVWVRLTVPVVAGEIPTGLQRAAAAADFCNGVSTELPFERYVFINPDLTVSLERPPVGEWVGLDAVTALGSPGSGVASARLWDRDGPVGRCLQSLLVGPR